MFSKGHVSARRYVGVLKRLSLLKAVHDTDIILSHASNVLSMLEYCSRSVSRNNLRFLPKKLLIDRRHSLRNTYPDGLEPSQFFHLVNEMQCHRLSYVRKMPATILSKWLPPVTKDFPAAEFD